MGVNVDASCYNESSENLASFIRDVMTRKKQLFQYYDDKIKVVETVGRTDICDFLKEPYSSGWEKQGKICFAPSSILRTPIRPDLLI